MATWIACLAFLAAPQGEKIIKAHSEAITDLSFSPDGKWIATSSMDLMVKIWDARNGKVTAVLSAGEKNPNNLAVHNQFYVEGVRFFPDSRRLATFGHSAKIWDTSDGQELADLITGFSASCLAVSPHGTPVARGGWSLTLWEGNSGKYSRTFEAGKGHRIDDLVFSADGKLLMSRGWINNALGNSAHLIVWSVGTGRALLDLGKDCWLVSHATLTPDGTRALAAVRNRNEMSTLKVWEVPTGMEICSVDFPVYLIDDLVVSPDSRCAVTRTWKGVVRLWDVKEGRERDVALPSLRDAVSFAFSPDGRLLVIGESRREDKKDREVPYLSIRDSITGRELACRRIGVCAVTESWSHLKRFLIHFSPDGRRMALTLGKGEFALVDLEAFLNSK